MSGYRLERGGFIDRSKPLSFTFDGARHGGFVGDTLASALIAGGVHLVGRSFKYHRPRGIVTAGAAEPNALVELREGGRKEANTRMTTIELHDGLIARSQSRWPSLHFDLGAINQLFSPFLVAGFYYKTFMWPGLFWEKIYEPLIRRAAGLGRATHAPDPDRYEKAYAHCDVLVIGSGPAGLMAALTAARSGARVIVAEEGSMLGGSLVNEREEIDGRPGHAWASEIVSELSSLPEVTLMPRTTVFGWYDDNIFGAVERVSDHKAVPGPHEPRQRYWRILAAQAVLAAGAEERPIVFGGNDRPGVMLASAVRTYVNRYAAAPGKAGVVFTNNDSGYRTARDLIAAGIGVQAIVDSRAETPRLDAGGARIIAGGVVTDVSGGRAVNGVEVRTATGHDHIDCDFVAMSGGWNPTLSLAYHRGGRPSWSDTLQAFVPAGDHAAFAVAGAANGTMVLSECMKEGAAKGARAASASGFDAKPVPAPRTKDESFALSPLWHVKSAAKAFVDFQNDVTAKDVLLSAQEGYRHIELTKRYTTLGMATDQGKLSNINGVALLAKATGKSIPEIGTTTYRPFYSPVAFGAIAGPFSGHHFQPVRQTPLHDWASENGAVFVETGLWMRSSWFPLPHETDWLESVTREVKATRERVGICDVSTLGKIDIQGPDAAELLNRLYCNGWSTLEVGKARYGLMLREDGVVFDDGTTSRLSDTHFFMTTTTANAARVMSHIEFCHQALWPDLDVQYVSVTEQWAQMAVAGPKARATLQKIVDDVTLDDTTFPYMAAKEIRILGGLPARLFRISFSGEHAYELSVPADYGNFVARTITHEGREFGITPYGVEALSVMRIEKGHVAGGELNGTTTAADLGLGRMMSTKKDYIGRMLAGREGLARSDRDAVVGIRPVRKEDRLRAGSHLLTRGDAPSMANDQGYITSVAYSPMLGQWIGLALCRRGRERHGETVTVFDDLRRFGLEAVICDPVHYDPENRKLHA
ncbi:MAG TPA: sarcosine oxidase subunit alpha family protein [Aestuariivirgaceae bacterium]|nr:sarcosine oxidase subunit alpha family protein [Aestuariivirgaceae bacterium]